MKKIIIFDLDGTLINSDPITINAINQIREEDKLIPLPPRDIIPFLPMGGIDLVKNTISKSNSIVKNETYLKKLRLKIEQHKIDDQLLFPNVRKTINFLQEKKIVLCICTNKGSSLVKKILKCLEIYNCFKNIIADGDLETRKPNKKNFIACMRGISFKNTDCLIIGDSRVDYELAKNSGVDFLAFHNKTNEDFINNYNDTFFEDFSELESSSLIFS